MIPKHLIRLAALTLAVIVSGLLVSAETPQGHRNFEDFWGNRYGARAGAPELSVNKASGLTTIQRWNRIAIDASGLDHTPVAPGENRVFGEQLGPCRAARAEAIVHVAMFEALNAIVGKYESHLGLYPVSPKTNRSAAIAQAAHDTLVVLFPSQKASFDTALTADLATIPNNKKKTTGILLGRTAALASLGERYNDGSAHAEPRLGVSFFTSSDAHKWRQDPISQLPIALGARWNEVRPFVMTSASQFRLPPPPAPGSAEYIAAFDEVQRLGGDGVTTATERTADQTQTGIYWAYDGTPSLCAPPRLYNQIVMQMAGEFGSNDIETMHLLALANVAMADAGIAAWDSKYFYQLCRPVTEIREVGDTIPGVTGDPTYSPLGAPASNLTGPNFTPPFPAYPSGHATFGAAMFQILRNVYNTDNHPFTFVSDEYNGETLDNEGNPRPLLPRSFQTFSEAEEENGQSRIYLGIHWSYDKSGGITQGRQVANWVFANLYLPVN